MSGFVEFPIRFKMNIMPSQVNSLETVLPQITQLGFAFCSDGKLTKDSMSYVEANPLILDKPIDRIEQLLELISSTIIEKVKIKFSQQLKLSYQQFLGIAECIEDEMTNLGIDVKSVKGRENLFPDKVEMIDYDMNKGLGFDRPAAPSSNTNDCEKVIIKTETPRGTISELEISRGEDATYTFTGNVKVLRIPDQSLLEEDIINGTKLLLSLRTAICNSRDQSRQQGHS